MRERSLTRGRSLDLNIPLKAISRRFAKLNDKLYIMIKRIFIGACILLAALPGFAQHEPNPVNTYSDEGNGTGFRKENLFLGGSLILGFGSYNFNVGASTEIGY